MSRVCDLAGCRESLEGMHPSRRFCSDAHRKEAKRKPAAKATPQRKGGTAIADRLRIELEKLSVLDSYEAQTTLGIAEQLDAKIVQGAAYVSLSKELDRRVDALRLTAEQPDSPVVQIQARVAEKQSHLRAV